MIRTTLLQLFPKTFGTGSGIPECFPKTFGKDSGTPERLPKTLGIASRTPERLPKTLGIASRTPECFPKTFANDSGIPEWNKKTLKKTFVRKKSHWDYLSIEKIIIINKKIIKQINTIKNEKVNNFSHNCDRDAV